jgi:predicted amidophosphoribosyltransferase
MKIHPVQVQGAWRLGWALDVHTTSSEFLGYDQNGHPQFDTTRSPLGELLYQLKYRGQKTAAQVATVMAEFFEDKPNALSRIDLIVPMPASTARSVQPVAEVAKALGKKLKKPVVVDAVKKARETPGLKGIQDAEERRELLDGAFKAAQAHVKGKSVLLVDDLMAGGCSRRACRRYRIDHDDS